MAVTGYSNRMEHRVIREQGVQNWLTKNVPNFFSANQWPPYSPDLNPCDYYLWGRLQSLVNTSRFDSVDQLKVAISSAWSALDNAEVVKACESFQKRLRQCVDKDGRYFE